MENNVGHESIFEPEENLTYVEYTDSGILQVPRNHTITNANLSLSSVWNPLPIRTAPLVIINLYRGMVVYPIPRYLKNQNINS